MKPEDGDVWLSRKQLQILFCKSESSIREALNSVKEVLQDRFSAKTRVFREMVQNSASGHIDVEKYNLDIVVRVGFRLNGLIAEAFQDWATSLIRRELEETINPNLTLERGVTNLQKRGASDKYIEARTKSIITRNKETDELKNRGVSGTGYGECTNATYIGMTGKNANGLREDKNLPSKANVRDHMHELELKVVELADAMAIHKMEAMKARGIKECKKCCFDGGKDVEQAWKNVQREINSTTA